MPSLSHQMHLMGSQLHQKLMATLWRSRFPFLEPAFAVDCLVIGGGVIGLAIARRLALAKVDNKQIFLVER
jgi:heterodisulfide reductase subunit A-like polyferredoxin